MSDIYTADQLKQKIIDLDAVIEQVTLTGKSYTLDTGQSSQTVTAETIPNFLKLRDYWVGLYEEQTSSGNVNYISTNW